MRKRESAYLEWMIALARACNWTIWHVPMPVRPIPGGRVVPETRGAGVPDIIAMHDDPPLLVFVELKAEGGKLSDAQKEFLRLARAVSDEVLRLDDRPYPSRTVGVYSFRPGMEPEFEAMFKSKVLM